MSSLLARSRSPLTVLRVAASLLVLMALFAPVVAAQQDASTFSLVRFPTPLPAPEFQAPTPSRAPLRLADFRGRYVLLNFWATWCAPCREEMPSMERLYRKLGPKRLTVVAVSQDSEVDQVPAMVAKLGVTFPIALDPTMKISDQFGVSALPSTFLIDPSGHVIAATMGGREWDSAGALAYFGALMQHGATQ